MMQNLLLREPLLLRAGGFDRDRVKGVDGTLFTISVHSYGGGQSSSSIIGATNGVEASRLKLFREHGNRQIAFGNPYESLLRHTISALQWGTFLRR